MVRIVEVTIKEQQVHRVVPRVQPTTLQRMNYDLIQALVLNAFFLLVSAIFLNQIVLS